MMCSNELHPTRLVHLNLSFHSELNG